MDAPLYDVAEGQGPYRSAVAARHPGLDARLARSVIGAAALLGITGDALMHDMHAGIAFSVWIALVALNAMALVWRAGRTVSRETIAWLSAAVVFAFGLAWRNSETLQAFDFLATIACLGMAALSARDPKAALFAQRLRDTFFTAIDVIVGVAVGVLPLAFREALVAEQGHRAAGRVRRLARPMLISAAALVVFGSLLRSADPIFASIVSLPALDMEAIVSHTLIAGFLAWVFAGWARAGLTANAPRHRAGPELPIQLHAADVNAALGTLIVLFGAFIATQLGWFFGGEEFLRARTGLTAATYARQGFFQMVWVVTLVVPVLVGTRAALAPDANLARRHTLLSLPVIALLGAIIVSAMLRMKMYTHFYGLTTDRFYPLVFMLWLAVVVVWLAMTVLRNWGRPFIAGTVISGLATLLALNIADPDAIVARVNIARVAKLSPSAQQELDLAHLATLNGGGVELATRVLLDNSSAIISAEQAAPAVGSHVDEQRCRAARRLLRQWGPASPTRILQTKDASWRFWNRDDAIALRVVSKESGALRALEHATCVVPRPPSP